MNNLEGKGFADLLQRFRKRARLTQQALAERLGAHRTTVSFWERGEYVPETLTMVLELARVLQLSEAEQRLLVEARFGTASILPFSNLPEQTPYFTGRDSVLQMLHDALAAGEQVALSQAHALSGLGGIGKTQTALAYASRYRTHYHDILWALADTRESLMASYMSFAEHLRLEVRAEYEQQKVVEAVKRWMREHKGWLLILDNIEDLGLAREFVPTPRQGAVLLTTRRTETTPLARPLPLDALPEEEGILFLLRRSGLLPLEASLEAATPAQQETARVVVQALGGLPLALDQAGAYIAETRCRLSDYLDLLQQERVGLLARRGTVPSEHPESVATTLALAFERVQQQSEVAGELLKPCAYLAPDAIPLDVLRMGAAELGPVLTPVLAQPLACNAALETLQAYSLVRRDAEQGTLSLHRLVQAVQQAALPKEEQRRWAERTVRLVSAAFPTAKAETWERCQQLLPHALVCAEHIGCWKLAFPEAASLLLQIGRYLHQRAQYRGALPLLQQALELYEQVYGSEHPDVARSLNHLADLYLAQGEYEQALPLFERALMIRERALGPHHLDVATTLNDLADLHREQGRYAQALSLAERALAIREQALGAHHPDVASSLNTLGDLYSHQGQYARALPHYQRALAIREQALGADHLDVATTLNNLANLYSYQGQYALELPLMQRALAIYEQALGPNHLYVAVSLNNLGDLYREQGKYEQALPLVQRALAIYEQAVGLDHPYVAASLDILASLYQAQGKYTEALLHYQQSLAIREQALGLVHPQVAISLNYLAGLFRVQGQDKEALPVYQRALAIREQALGPDHPRVATTLNNMADFYHARGQNEQALPLAQRALTIREQALGPDHRDVAESLNSLALIFQAQGQEAQALPLLQRAVAIWERVLPDHPDTATSLKRLAALLRRLEFAQEASELEGRLEALHSSRNSSS
ncbi:MAG TPA: FxSxx-COOH system tetratricopeptide repeat protein [Ktedonobacterales bacterium]